MILSDILGNLINHECYYLCREWLILVKCIDRGYFYCCMGQFELGGFYGLFPYLILFCLRFCNLSWPWCLGKMTLEDRRFWGRVCSSPWVQWLYYPGWLWSQKGSCWMRESSWVVSLGEWQVLAYIWISILLKIRGRQDHLLDT